MAYCRCDQNLSPRLLRRLIHPLQLFIPPQAAATSGKRYQRIMEPHTALTAGGIELTLTLSMVCMPTAPQAGAQDLAGAAAEGIGGVLELQAGDDGGAGGPLLGCLTTA